MPRTMISHQARTSSPPQALRPERPALSWAFSAPSARSGAYLLFWAARSPRLRSSRGTSSPSPLQRCQRACPSKARWALTPAWHVAADGSAAQGEVRVAQRWKQRRNTAICAIDPHNTSISPTNCMSPCRRAFLLSSSPLPSSPPPPPRERIALTQRLGQGGQCTPPFPVVHPRKKRRSKDPLPAPELSKDQDKYRMLKRLLQRASAQSRAAVSNGTKRFLSAGAQHARKAGGWR